MLTDDLLKSASTTLVRRINKECRRDWIVKFQHVFRETNKVINCITKSSSENNYELKMIESSMFDVRQLLLEDKMGDFHVRIIGT